MANFVSKLISSFLVILYVLIIATSVVPYTIILWSWIVVSAFLPITWFHKVEDRLWGWYQRMIVFFFEHCTGVEVFIKGNIPQTVENALVISNHQSLLDWIVADFIALRQGMVGNMRYVFKNSLKYYPLYGFGFGIHGGVFVRRDGQYNDRNMSEILQKLIKRNASLYFLVYPEGTRFNSKRKDILEKSQSFAIKSGLTPLTQVLTPRVKAFDSALNSLNTYIHAIYDITVIYDTSGKDMRPQPPSALQFLAGQCKRVYIHFERIPVDDALHKINTIKETDRATASMKWLHGRFEIKENILRDFYNLDEVSNGATDGNNSANRNKQQRHKLGKRSKLPLSYTFPAAAAFVLVNAFSLYFLLGRWMYLFTCTIGMFFCVLYAHFFFK
ncbi:1-acyl-sn-glycerol-3-phosphate acyltransferase epsilon-like [Clavelina lepadiformis]